MSNELTAGSPLSIEKKCDTLVGIDSDGCVFDTMEVKQKQCFHPLIISFWNLEPIAKYVRETAEFVNLYSKSRGSNRFVALVKTMDLLRRRPEAAESGVPLPSLKPLRDMIFSGVPLGNPTLTLAIEQTGNNELRRVLEWSERVNEEVSRVVTDVPPFKWVTESLREMRGNSDCIVVSQTPEEAIVREWEQHGIREFVSLIAGQESGTKSEHLRIASGGRYGKDRVLMIGDAPGDRKAAESVGALFYPVNPGREEDSWERFFKEAYKKFIAGGFAGRYQEELVEEFEALLPDNPSWNTVKSAPGEDGALGAG